MKKFCFGVMVVGAAVGAQAGFYEDSDVFPLGLTDFTGSVTLDKFDPNFGDLISVTYTLETTLTGTVTVDSENPATTSVTITVAGTIEVRDGLTTLLAVNPSTSDGATLGPDSDAGPDFLGSDAASFSASLTESTSSTVSDAPSLAWFTAAILGETFTWTIDANGLSNVDSSGNRAEFVQQSASGKVTVRYEYGTQVVPEASTCLTGLGLAGMAAMAGRRMLRR